MFRILCVSVCFLTIDCSLSNLSVVFSSPDDTVSLICSSPRLQFYNEELLRWVHLSPIGSMKDSGRYYCAEHSASYLTFINNGTVLHVGDVWTNKSEVLLLTEWWDEPNRNLTAGRDEDPAEMLCVVTSLRTPWVPVTWRSSLGAEVNITSRTWSTMLSLGEYCVISWLQQPSDDKGEWWCEVQIGTHEVRKSSKSLFKWKKKEQEWYYTALAPFIAVCILFGGLLSIFSYYGFCQLGGMDVTTGLTYAHLDFKDKQKHQERRIHSHTDRMVYSEVRYNSDG
ncbi:hypothetical protein GN956_G21940 [Arapaima gigas]